MTDTTDASGDVIREVEIDGALWIASLAGRSAAGSGGIGLGMLEGVYFALASSPGTPLRETLLQMGSFARMYDAEIVSLFRRSTPVSSRITTQESH